MERMVEMASVLHPPRVSTTSRTKVIPAAQQVEVLEATFLLIPTWREWPRLLADSARVSCCRDEITVMSKAAGLPQSRFGGRHLQSNKLSPGLKQEPPSEGPEQQTKR